MDSLTVAQTFALVDAMASYVMLTNPWGSGESSDTDDEPPKEWSVTPDGTPDPFFAGGSARSIMAEKGMVDPNMSVLPRSAAPADIQDLLR